MAEDPVALRPGESQQEHGRLAPRREPPGRHALHALLEILGRLIARRKVDRVLHEGLPGRNHVHAERRDLGPNRSLLSDLFHAIFGVFHV